MANEWLKGRQHLRETCHVIDTNYCYDVSREVTHGVPGFASNYKSQQRKSVYYLVAISLVETAGLSSTSSANMILGCRVTFLLS